MDGAQLEHIRDGLVLEFANDALEMFDGPLDLGAQGHLHRQRVRQLHIGGRNLGAKLGPLVRIPDFDFVDSGLLRTGQTHQAAAGEFIHRQAQGRRRARFLLNSVRPEPDAREPRKPGQKHRQQQLALKYAHGLLASSVEGARVTSSASNAASLPRPGKLRCGVEIPVSKPLANAVNATIARWAARRSISEPADAPLSATTLPPRVHRGSGEIFTYPCFRESRT